MQIINLLKLCLQSEDSRIHSVFTNNCFRLFQVKVHSYLLRLGANNELAEDLTQETFIRLFLSLKKLKKINKAKEIEGFLLVIARNLFFNHQKKKRLQTVPLDNMLDMVYPDSNVQSRSSVLLQRSLKHLSERQRKVMSLLIEGYDYECISKEMKLSESNIRKHVSRSIHKLKKLHSHGQLKINKGNPV